MNTPEQITRWDAVHEDRSNAQTEPDAWLINYLEQCDARSHHILDLGCGCGRHLIWLLNRGWRATGLDWSPMALRHTKAALNERKLIASLIKEDFRKLRPGSGSYKYIISTKTLNHGMASDFLRAITSIRNVMGIGGKLIFNVPTVRNEPINLVNGQWLEDHTLVLFDSLEAGIPHHFFSEDEVRSISQFWRDVEIETVVEPLPAGREPLHAEHVNEWMWVTLTR